MGFIMSNGRSYGANGVLRITQEAYDALPESKNSDNIMYLIEDGSPPEEYDYPLSAQSVFYNNQNSGLPAFNVQNALDQLSCYEDVSDKFVLAAGSNLSYDEKHAYRIGNMVYVYAFLYGTTFSDDKLIMNFTDDIKVKENTIFTGIAISSSNGSYNYELLSGMIDRFDSEIHLTSCTETWDNIVAMAFSAWIPIETTVSAESLDGETYLDITDQITVPDGSPINSQSAYVMNGIVALNISVKNGTVHGTYTASVSEEYAPIKTTAGSVATWGDTADIGRTSCWIESSGTIKIVVKETTSGNQTYTILYPLKKPMSRGGGN